MSSCFKDRARGRGRGRETKQGGDMRMSYLWFSFWKKQSALLRHSESQSSLSPERIKNHRALKATWLCAETPYRPLGSGVSAGSALFSDPWPAQSL